MNFTASSEVFNALVRMEDYVRLIKDEIEKGGSNIAWECARLIADTALILQLTEERKDY